MAEPNRLILNNSPVIRVLLRRRIAGVGTLVVPPWLILLDSVFEFLMIIPLLDLSVLSNAAVEGVHEHPFFFYNLPGDHGGDLVYRLLPQLEGFKHHPSVYGIAMLISNVALQLFLLVDGFIWL